MNYSPSYCPEYRLYPAHLEFARPFHASPSQLPLGILLLSHPLVHLGARSPLIPLSTICRHIHVQRSSRCSGYTSGGFSSTVSRSRWKYQCPGTVRRPGKPVLLCSCESCRPLLDWHSGHKTATTPALKPVLALPKSPL
jgi:hypothetical protein